MLITTTAFFIAAATCNRDPAVTKLADPDVPKAYYQQLSGTRVATVAVTLDSSGAVTDARIYQSTGDATLDAAAVDAAKRSAYSPGASNCAPSGGTFAVQFSFVGETAAALDCPHPARVTRTVIVTPQPGTWPPFDALVAVEITIDADGQLVDARITQSSNNMALDQAAIASARASTYEPKTIAVPVRRQAGQASGGSSSVCRAVRAQYLFKVHYDHP